MPVPPPIERSVIRLVQIELPFSDARITDVLAMECIGCRGIAPAQKWHESMTTRFTNYIISSALLLSLFGGKAGAHNAPPVGKPAPRAGNTRSEGLIKAPSVTDAPLWISMPILTAEQKQAGIYPGGEGCQWPRGLDISEASPNFLILSIDVGGLYRTLDGGKYWQQATVGWNARGCNGVAIDPKNSRHVLGLGGNANDWGVNWGPTPHGIYLSIDQASSWRHTLGLTEGFGNAIAFDSSSYDPTKKICTIAYMASIRSGLWKSVDGGANWSKVSDIPATIGQPDGGTAIALKVSPRGGIVFIGGKAGLFVSRDGGISFTSVRQKSVYSLSVVSSAPNSLWISGADGILVSHDDGKTFTNLPAGGVDREADNKPLRNIVVNPADPTRMTVWVQGDNYKWVRYVSQDGGASFSPIRIVKGAEPMPYNVRNGFNAWHPNNSNILYGLGGDWVTRSTDSGKTLNWYNNGNNGVMVGGMMNFSAHDPNVTFLAFQDYNAAVTRDNGATWTYMDASGKGWGGFCYGGIAIDRQTFVYGDADSWGGGRIIRTSFDGGKTWDFAHDPAGKLIRRQGADVSFSDPADIRIAFCGDHRSTDKGRTWSKMPDCEGVFTASPTTRNLYGKRNSTLLRSQDHGATWEIVAVTTGNISDIAVDPLSGRIYVASEEKLKVWESGKWIILDVPSDQFGRPLRCQTVAIDPGNPAIVYIGGSRDIYLTHTTVARSTDRGATWKNLTVTTPIKPGMPGGPHEVSSIRVHPTTHEAWVAGQCFGMWRIAAPSPTDKGFSASQASAPRTIIPPLAPALPIPVVTIP